MTTQPIYARVSDHVGRKVPYLVASGIFLIGLVLSANAFSWAALVTARAICGLGIAGVMTMGKYHIIIFLEHTVSCAKICQAQSS